MADEIDPLEIPEKSEEELNERLQELKEIPYLNQAESQEYDLIDDELYRRAVKSRKQEATKGL